MTHNLNSALGEDFVERCMIKIIDEKISDGYKYEAEKNKNETDKIKEIPMDDTIEEKYKEIHRSFLNVAIETMDKLKEDSNIFT